MPTSTEQVVKMQAVIDRYLLPDKAESLFAHLYDEVGQYSTNQSVKLSLLMLKMVYAQDGRSINEKMDDLQATFTSYYIDPYLDRIFGIGFLLVVGVHFLFIFGLVGALLALPFLTPWYEWLPLCTFVVFLLTNPIRCPLTAIENKLRSSLGMPEIRHFVLHYIVQPARRFVKRIA